MRNLKVKSIFLFVVCYLTLLTGSAQTEVTDFEKQLVAAKTRKEKISLLLNMSYQFSEGENLSEVFGYAKNALALAKEENNTELLGDAYVNIGIRYKGMLEYEKALDAYLKGSDCYEKINDKNGLAYVSFNMSHLYFAMKNYDLSLTYSQNALTYYEEIQRFPKMVLCWIQQGAIYYAKNDIQKSLNSFEKALVYYEENGNLAGCAAMENNIGSLYNEMKQYDMAIQKYKHALDIYTKQKDSVGVAMCMANIGNIYNEAGKMQDAIPFILKGLAIAEERKDNNIMVSGYVYIVESYQKLGEYKNAFDFQSKLLMLKDTIYDLESNQNIAEMQTKFDTEKKEKQNQILKQQNELQILNINRQKIINYSITGGLLLVLGLAFFIYKGYKQKQKANLQLEEKNMLIEVKNKIVEEKNKDITDSIRYAKRLQTAILKPENTLTNFFDDGFILFKPKDIVSGDFYWFEKFGNLSLIAAADCTGHGVPGAFMSIIGCNLLSQAVNEYAITQPAAILNSINKGLTKVLQQNVGADSFVTDGMDIALCSYDPDKMMVEYAGAFNPMWLIRNNKVIEFTADKFPVGAFVDSQVRIFNSHKVPVQKGDMIYLFSDGYADQFGGPLGKKFKYKPMQALLLENCNKPGVEQRLVLNNAFEKWAGNLEQIDDVLIIGIRI